MFTRLPIAWLNLTHKPGRLVLSLGGIVFAAVLMFMFVGFKQALYDSQLRLIEQLNGDVFMVHSRRASLIAPVQFPTSMIHQAESSPTIDKAVPLYLGRADWLNPNGKTVKTVRLIAFNPNVALFKFPELRSYQSALQLPETVLVDRFARAEIGERQRGVVTELGDRYVEVVGNFDLGNDFAAYNGNVITSEENFLRYQNNRNPKQSSRSLDQVDIGVLFTSAQSTPERAAEVLRQQLTNTISIYTRQDLLNWELNIWKNGSNIGFIFSILTLMGFVIGIVLCYQILYADVTNNLQAYATVKAIGYEDSYLSFVILQQALLLSVLGFIPAAIISHFLYKFSISVTGLIFRMSFERVGYIFLMTVVMCVLSGLISVLKVQRCDPAEVF